MKFEILFLCHFIIDPCSKIQLQIFFCSLFFRIHPQVARISGLPFFLGVAIYCYEASKSMKTEKTNIRKHRKSMCSEVSFVAEEGGRKI